MIYLDFSQDYQLLFQDPASPMMNGIIDLHHYVMFFLFVILTFVVVMLSTVIELFVFKQTIHNFDHYDVLAERDLTKMFKSSAEDRELVLNNFKKHMADNKDSLAKRRQVSLMSQWNNFWSELHGLTGTNNVSAADFSIEGNKKISLVTQVSTGSTFIKGGVQFLNQAGNPVISNNFSQYLSTVYLRNNKYDSTLPSFAVASAHKQINESSLESLAIVNVFQSYTLNLYYWMQTYFTLRSGIQNFTHSTVIEIVWTVIPSLVLVFIGVPSFILLYAMDEIIEPDLVVKCIGHQWYWSYEIEYPNYFFNINKEVYDTSYADLDTKSSTWWSDVFYRAMCACNVNSEPYIDYGTRKLENIHWGYMNFNSYMINEDELKVGTPRLLEVDNPLFLPIKTHIDLLVTANDVLHCWTVPSFGVKIDAVPGRINHVNVFIERSGVFYGQCSEICGVNHGFMPIKVIAVSLREFLTNINK